MKKGDLVICVADVTDHIWYAGCNCPVCKPNRKKVMGPNKDEVVRISRAESGGLAFEEYPDASAIGVFPIEEFSKLPPMNINKLIEDCITELTI